MADREPLSVGEFGLLFQDFLQRSLAHAPVREPELVGRLREHLGVEPEELPIVREHFGELDRPNLQVGLDAYGEAPDNSLEVIGLMGSHPGAIMGYSLSALLGSGRHPHAGMLAPQPGPVEYVNVALADGQVLPCVAAGLFLVRSGEDRLAMLLSHVEQGPKPGLTLEVMARDAVVAGATLSRLGELMRERNVYRGHVLTLSQPQMGMGGMRVEFSGRPSVQRSDIVLPDGALDRVERHTVEFTRHSDKLLAAGRHLRRGLLLHGPPGTGKTLTVKYLAAQLQDRTVVLLTGGALNLVGPSCELARQLEPAMVVLEDVDLVGMERTFHGAPTGLLFELLNQMDGLAPEADVVFVLTTNRADLLEPALAARPGRVDQALELPLPDTDSRRRLMDLYARGLELRVTRMDEVVERTAGASPAFIKELLRQAAMAAAPDSDDRLVVEDDHLLEALDEMVGSGDSLTRRLLGAQQPDEGAPPPGFQIPPGFPRPGG
jgi:hypothetical protein